MISQAASLFERSQLPDSTLKDIVEWDIQTWSRALDFWAPVLRAKHPDLTRVLTVGERNGGLSLWFALQGYRVTCSDYGGPTPQARALHERYGVSDRITYADVNIFACPYPELSFDIVACKSVIGGLKLVKTDRATRTLNNQSMAVGEIHRILTDGGYFLGAENLAGSRFHQLARGLIKQGRLGWRHLTIGEIGRLFSSFAQVEQQTYGFLGSRLTRFALGWLTATFDSLFCPFLPPQWHYVSFIRARKQSSMLADQSHTDAASAFGST